MKKLTLPIIIALFSCISLQAKDLLEKGYRGMVVKIPFRNARFFYKIL